MDQFNLLDLDNDILNIIGDYVKADNLDRISNEKLKQDILEYVDMKMKLIRKEARDEKYYISRSYTRYLIWVRFAEFCYNYFGVEYLNDIDKYNK